MRTPQFAGESERRSCLRGADFGGRSYVVNSSTHFNGKWRIKKPITDHGQPGTQACAGERSIVLASARHPVSTSTSKGSFPALALISVRI